MKYKYSRKEWAMEFSKWLGFDDKYAEFDQDAKDERKWLRDLLATKTPKNNQKKKLVGYYKIKGKTKFGNSASFSKPESDKESKCPACKNPTVGYLHTCWMDKPQEELEVEELDINISKLYGKNEIEVVGKLGKLIKAHNALVKEVRKQ